MNSRKIGIEIRECIAKVTFRNPDKLNAWDGQMLEELKTHVDEIATRDDVRMVVFTGEGRAFSVGADLNWFTPDPQTHRFRVQALYAHNLFDAIEELEKPVVAAINGLCVGGGLEFALSCDLRVAVEEARFGFPEVNAGIIPASGGCSRLARLVGVGNAKELVLTGELISASEAKDIGLINAVVFADLGQIKNKRWPVRLLWDNGLNGGASADVLAYYGLTKESIEAAGGNVASGVIPSERKDFDVIIYQGSLSNAPEFNVWYEVSQKYDLTYLQLPDDLLAKLARDWDMERHSIPNGLLRGIEHSIPSVAFTGNAIYGRTDMPDDFAYTVAKAMDEHQDLLPWSYENYSYNSRTVWKDYGVPLHPGAARYYREKHYMK